MADVTVVDTAVSPTANTVQEVLTAGDTITAGQPVYKDLAAAGVVKRADADTAVTAVCYGIALCNASSLQPIVVARSGDIDFNNAGVGAGPFAVGETYVVSTLTGRIAPESDLGSGDFVTILGVAAAADILALKIQNSGTAKA